jgi:hypothetical protein
MNDEDLMKVRGIGGSGVLGRISVSNDEILTPINLPEPFILDKESFIILYKGHVFNLSRRSSHINYAKICTATYGLEETKTMKELEDIYFQENQAFFDRSKKEFLEKVINSVRLPQGIDSPKDIFGKQIANEIRVKIDAVYLSTDSSRSGESQTSRTRRSDGYEIGHLNTLRDGSILNTQIDGFDRILKIESKLYDLLTIPEYLAKFQEYNKFDPSFYRSLRSMSETATPEEVSRYLKQNKDMISDSKTLQVIKDKIWSGVKTCKIRLDGTYFIPEYRGSSQELINPYRSLIEKRIKIDAARAYSILMGGTA